MQQWGKKMRIVVALGGNALGKTPEEQLELVKETAKLQQKKYRTQSGKFLLEGYKAIKEAFDCGIKIDCQFKEGDIIEEFIEEEIK